jgi:putative flippase GtrA
MKKIRPFEALTGPAGKFLIVGGLNTAIDFGVFLLLFYVFEASILVSHVTAFVLAVINSFICNGLWTFRQGASSLNAGNFIKFAAVSLCALVASTLAIAAFSYVVTAWIAKMLAIAASLTVNYIGMSRLVFRKN